MQPINIAGPWFEDLERGQEFDAPAVTLTEAHAVLYQSLSGDRLRLPLDHAASRRVTGHDLPFIHPLLVINIVIGQSTWVSQRVKGNLFYRGLVLRRPLHVGDTLSTRTRVVALRQNSTRPGRAATGVVALEIVTRDQHGREVLRFWRCPMLPCRDAGARTPWNDDVESVGSGAVLRDLSGATPAHWQTASLHAEWSGLKSDSLSAGMKFRIASRDTVTGAPEFVRATLNVAMAHADARESYLGARLVYGGHTVAIAFAQVTRALPNLLTVVAWENCDHTGPVLENDLLRSDVTLIEKRPSLAGTLLKLKVETYASRGADAAGETAPEAPVLDWTFWALSL